MTPDTGGVAAVAASSVAELAWIDGHGSPDACGVVALLWGGSPAIAFTYAAADRARRIAATRSVALTVTEPRSTAAVFAPTAIHGRPRLLEDLDGSVFVDKLLDQELRRFPPARKYADSPMLMREHWWYLPRLILTVDVDRVRPIAARQAREDHLLVVATQDGPVVQTVAAGDPSGDAAGGRSVGFTPRGADTPPPGPAVMLGQDASFPDLEQWSTWCFRGGCDGSRIDLIEDPPRTGLEPVPSVWQRLRRVRAFGHACRSGIGAAERSRTRF